jgi:hypothetical protein
MIFLFPFFHGCEICKEREQERSTCRREREKGRKKLKKEENERGNGA